MFTKVLKTASIIFMMSFVVGLIYVIPVNAETVPAHSIQINKNPEFDANSADWDVSSQAGYTMATSAITDPATWGGNGKVLKITQSFTTAGWWHNRLYQSNVPVVSGVAYTLTIRAKADAARTADVALTNLSTHIYVDTHNGVGTPLALTTTPTVYTYTFTATATENLQLVFNIAQSTIPIYFDYVRVTYDLPALNNIAKDGTFDEPNSLGSSGSWSNYTWFFVNSNGANASASIASSDAAMGSTNVFKVTPGSTVGTHDYDSVLCQYKIPFKANSLYYVQFDARADTSRTIGVFLQQEKTPWSTYSKQTLSLYTYKTTYVIPVQTAADSLNGNNTLILKFALGLNANPVYIDNVKVLEPLPTFSMQSSSLTNNQVNVAVYSPISFNYSNNLDPACLDVSHITLTGGTTNAIYSISQSSDGKGFTIHLDKGLDFNTWYTLRLTGIRDVYTQTVADVQIMFQTLNAIEFGTPVFKSVYANGEMPIEHLTAGTIEYSIVITKNDDTTQPSALVIARYIKNVDNGSIELVDAACSTYSLVKGTNTLSVQIDKVPQDYSNNLIKVFLWDTFDNMHSTISEVVLE